MPRKIYWDHLKCPMKNNVIHMQECEICTHGSEGSYTYRFTLCTFESEKSNDPFTQNDWMEILVAMGTKDRFNIVILLSNEDPMTLPEIAMELGIEGVIDNGSFPQSWLDTYINPLLMKDLIDYLDHRKPDRFIITEKAKKILDILFEQDEAETLVEKEKHCFKKFKVHGRHSGECTYSGCYEECYQHYLDNTTAKERLKDGL